MPHQGFFPGLMAKLYFGRNNKIGWRAGRGGEGMMGRAPHPRALPGGLTPGRHDGDSRPSAGTCRGSSRKSL